MKYKLKKNIRAEEAYIRDMQLHGPLEKVERREAKILSTSKYLEPVRWFLSRQRNTLSVRLSAPAKRRLEQFSRATGMDIDELARRWVEQAIARKAG